MINTCFNIAIPFYHRVYLISPTVFSPPWLFPYPVWGATTRRWRICESSVLGASPDDLSRRSSSKQSPSEQSAELPSDMGALRDLLSIGLARSGDSRSELSIRSSRVFLYWLGIATISEFPTPPPTASLTTRFPRIETIRCWRGGGVSAQVFPRRAYAPVKQTLSICNIVHQPFAYQSLLFEPKAQSELRSFQSADLNYSIAPSDLWLQQQAWYI